MNTERTKRPKAQERRQQRRDVRNVLLIGLVINFKLNIKDKLSRGFNKKIGKLRSRICTYLS